MNSNNKKMNFNKAVFSGFIVSLLFVTAGLFLPKAAEANYQKQKVDVGIVKTTDSFDLEIGATGKFILTATNYNPVDATEVKVSDILPINLEFISVTSSAGNYSTTTGEWIIGSLAENQTETLEITFLALSEGVYINSAEVFSKETDDYLDNNTDWVEICVKKATTPVKPPAKPKFDLAITKSSDKPEAFVDDEVIFTVTASNNSSSTAAGVFVKDLLPFELNLVSATSTKGIYSTSTGVWTLGSMQATSTAKLILTVTASTTGTFTNIAEIFSEELEKDVINNKAFAKIKVVEKDVGGPPAPTPPTGGGSSAPSGGGGGSGGGGSTVVKTADVGIEKSATLTEVNELNTFIFKLTATNHGPDAATNVVVTDVLPAGLQFITASSTSGSNYLESTGSWSIGALSKDATAILFIEVKTLAGTASTTITNIASIDAAEPDPNAANDQDRTEVHVRAKEVRGEEDKPVLPITGLPLNPWAVLLILLGIVLTIIESFWHGFKKSRK